MEPSGAANPRSAHPGKTANPEQAFFQLDLMRSLQLHRRLALAIAAVGLVLGIVYYFAMAPVYLAQSLVYVQPAPPSVLQQGYSTRWPYDATTYDSYIQQQIQNVMREDVLSSALKKLGDGGKKPNESDQDALNRLRRGLDVARVGQTYQFTIGARASNPELAAQTSNAVAASYIESTTHDQKAGDEQRLTMLREERDRVQSALDADRAEQQELNKQLGVASVGAAPDHFDEDIAEIRTELVKARTEHDAAEAKFTAMGANHGTSSNAIDAAADESADTDAGLVSMKTALNARKAFLISKMANLTPGNPEYKQDAAELAQINANLDQMMKDLSNRAASHIQLQLRSELERTAGVEAQLNAQLRQLVSSATNATSKLQRASDLAADITRLQSRYSAVDEQLHNRMLEDAAPSGAYVSTPAEVPDHRAKSGRTRNALAIVMAGLFLGMLAAVVRNKMDRRIYVGSDLEGVLGFGPMALLPDFGEVSDGAAEEHLMRLAAAIEHAHKQGHLRSCIFTGASSGTGVTTIVTRVRTLLEAMGRPTVYVDASGTSAEEESSGAAAGDQQGTQALVTAGGRSRQSALSNQMADEGDSQVLVLTDAAPIAVSAETEYLARFADCAIVVVESGVTTRAEIRDAAATLQRLNVGAVGFVLNRVGMAKADPAFRASVDAIEKHLQSQIGAVARRTKRTEALPVAKGANLTLSQGEVSLSEPVVHPQAPAASPQATDPNRAALETARVEENTERPAGPEVPSWMVTSREGSSGKVSSNETSVAKTWAQAWPAAGALAVTAVASSVEPSLGAPLLETRPASSFEPINRQEAASMNLPEPASGSTFAAPVAPKAEGQALRVDESQSNVEAIASSAETTGDPTDWEQDRHGDRPEVRSSESPTGPVPVVHQSIWAQQEHLPVAAQPESPRTSELPTGSVAAIPSEKPLPAGDPDIPWWLSDVPGQRAEQPIPLLWQGEKAGKSRKEGTPLGPDPVGFPRLSDPSWIKRGGSPPPQPVSARGGGAHGYRGPEPAQPPAHFAEQEEAPERLTSRLSGLRNLLTGLGLKEVHSSANDSENADRTPLDRGSSTAATPNQSSLSNAPSSASSATAVASVSSEVSAQPEFLKPVSNVAEHRQEGSKAGEKSSHRTSQPATEFEEATLPSRRGQYRNL
jgi:uncharacterized protein involved in exopolysaccharide biosynthesis